MNTPHETTDSIERSAYDSAMSEEYKMPSIEVDGYDWIRIIDHEELVKRAENKQRSLAQQEILGRVDKVMDKYIEDWYDKYKGCGMADAQQAIKEMKISVLSTLKDTNI